MMATSAGTSAQSNPPKRTSFSGYQGASAALRLEKAKSAIRLPTPDSEALASSDDEQQEQHHQLHSMVNSQVLKPVRRPSWLSEVQQVSQRRGSLNGNGNFSPVSSHPATPVVDPTPWSTNMSSTAASTVGRGHSSSTSFPWGGAIWSNDSQKGPPARLTEVLPSPKSLVHPGSTGFYRDDPLASPPITQDSVAEPAIPFAIPLHPTPKTYRSQSYSVGQLDPETVNTLPGHTSNHMLNGRSRPGSSYAGLQHRPSRPSMLGDLSHDASVLGQLREVDDDDNESSNGSEAGVQLSSTQAHTIEQLAMENALLRKAAAHQLENGRLKNRAATTTAASNGYGSRFNAQLSHLRIAESPTEEADYSQAILEDLATHQAHQLHGTSGRRFSEYSANTTNQFSILGIPENRKLESVKKGHWQSSLGFGGSAEIPQSRRHSFADVPTRHGSISSASDPQHSTIHERDMMPSSNDLRSLAGYGEEFARQSHGDSGEYAHFRSRHSIEEEALELEHLRNRHFAASYFSNMNPIIRSPELYRSSTSPTSVHLPYAAQNQYVRSQPTGNPQPHHDQLLYLVTFKACRAEVYYVQEGTGLQVKTGDLVIVEADRGTDLGTIAHENIMWSAAKDLKECFAEEHYKWLMMFSRHGQNGATVPTNPNALPNPASATQMGATGGMGTVGQLNPQDVPHAELKPKMIKRLAQSHEIQVLRDKEGNEAKAKRVCQQKVVEHRLNMEILDAEFQMLVNFRSNKYQ